MRLILSYAVFLVLIIDLIVQIESTCSLKSSICTKKLDVSKFCKDTDTGESDESEYVVNCPFSDEYVNESYKVAELFRKASIVPQIIPNPPKELLIGYLSTTQLELGNYVPPFVFGFPPRMTWNVKPGSLYTLIALNLDGNFALYGTYKYLILSLLVVNIPGNDRTLGERLLSYQPILPFPGFGAQRYIGLVYEQEERLYVTPEELMRISANSSRFDFNKFRSDKNLKDPLAGNFYISSLLIDDCPPLKSSN